MLALLLTAQLLSSAQSDESSAQVGRPPPSEEATPAPPPAPAPTAAPAPAAAPARGASLAAGPTTRRKSTNFLVAAGGVGLGALAAYLGFVGGVAVNFSKGGLSDPLDAYDVLLLMVVPAAGAAVFSWAVGLFDYSQRGVLGSAAWAVIGAGVGELAGLGVGVLVGRAMYANDAGMRGLVMVGIAPAVAALCAVLFMEFLKPGEEVEGAYASLSVARARGGGLAVGPAFGFGF